MTSRQLAVLLGALLIGLAIAKGVRAEEIDALEAACPVGSEFRVEYRRESSPVVMRRLYVGCRDPQSLATWTYYAELSPAQESQWRTLGSRAISTSRTWTRPAVLTMPVWTVARTPCDRWYLWAVDEGTRAPKMTRAQKLKQACAP